MAALTGNSIATTYTGLLKTSDSGARGAEGSADQCSDGAGNTIPLFVSATEVYAVGSGTGTSHTAFGKDCGVDLAAGTGNSLFGEGAGADLSTGEHNVALGYRALYQGTTETDDCVAIGYNAMSGAITTQVVNDVVAIGSGAIAGAAEDEVSGSIAIGTSALAAVTTGAGNTAVGYQAATAVVAGEKNTVVGYQAYLTSSHADGDNNTVMGYLAGADLTEGASNVVIGSLAGNTSANDLATGDSNTIIGASANGGNAGAVNRTVIGYGAIGSGDNSVTLGNADVNTVYMAQDSGATVHAANVISNSNYAVEGYTTGRNVLRCGKLTITGVTSGTQFKLKIDSVFNGEAIAEETVDTGNPTNGSRFDTDGNGGLYRTKTMAKTVVAVLYSGITQINDTYFGDGQVLTAGVRASVTGGEISWQISQYGVDYVAADQMTNNLVITINFVYITSD